MSGGAGGIPGFPNIFSTMAQLSPAPSGATSDFMLGAQTATSPPSSPSGASAPGVGGTSTDLSSLLSSPQAMQVAQGDIRSMNAGLLQGLPSGMRAANPAGLPAGFFQNTMGVGKG